MIERMELGEFYKELRLARKLKQSRCGLCWTNSLSVVQV